MGFPLLETLGSWIRSHIASGKGRKTHLVSPGNRISDFKSNPHGCCFPKEQSYPQELLGKPHTFQFLQAKELRGNNTFHQLCTDPFTGQTAGLPQIGCTETKDKQEMTPPAH